VNASLLSPLNRLEECPTPPAGPTPGDSPKSAPGQKCSLPPSRSCVLYFFYDLADQQEVHLADEQGLPTYVKSPRSVHFAFRNAGLTLDSIFGSSWNDCRELVGERLQQQVKKCRESVTSDGTSDVNAEMACLVAARERNRVDEENCNKVDGAKLPQQLGTELDCIRERWTPLHNRFYELEKRLGGVEGSQSGW
jgi:hypothetical protein